MSRRLGSTPGLVCSACLGIALVVAACSVAGSPVAPSATAAEASAPESSEGEPGPRSPVAGIVTSIDSQGLDKVKGFTLRTNSGIDLTFVLGKLDNPTEFPPGHLAEHQASASPVLVSFKKEGGKLVVYHLEDAP